MNTLKEYYKGWDSMKLYQRPSRDAFRKIIADIRQHYQITESPHFALIQQLETEFKHNDAHIKSILGGLIFELSFCSPDEKSFIYKRLGLSDRGFSDDERFVYLHCFKKYISNKNLIKPFENKIELLKLVDEQYSLAAKKSLEKSEFFSNGLFLLETLVNEISSMEKKYKKGNEKRLLAFKFIRFVDEVCRERYKQNRHDEANCIETCNALVGAIILPMLSIKKESQHRYFFSAEGGWFTSGSTGFQILLSMLRRININNVDDLSREQRLIYLHATKTILDTIRMPAMRENYEKTMKDVEIDEKQLNKFYSELTRESFHQEEKAKEPSFLERTGDYLAQYSTGLMLTKYTSEVFLPICVKTVVGGSLGPTALAMYATGFAGTFLVSTQLGRLVNDHVIKPTTAYVWASALQMLCYAGKKAATAAFGIHSPDAYMVSISVTPEGLQMLLEHPDIEPDAKEFMIDLIAALHDSPLVSKEDKAQLDQFFNHEKQDELYSFELVPR